MASSERFRNLANNHKAILEIMRMAGPHARLQWPFCRRASSVWIASRWAVMSFRVAEASSLNFILMTVSAMDYPLRLFGTGAPARLFVQGCLSDPNPMRGMIINSVNVCQEKNLQVKRR
jgi:hypothetical protein